MSENEKLRAVPNERVLCFDVETTGLSSYDEILQLSIIDGAGRVLFNEYIKPCNHTAWEQAESINGISPSMVVDKPTLEAYRDSLNAIFANAELIVGYNSISFDNGFLERAGIVIPETALQYDVMIEFAPIYGDWNEKYGDYKWQKLSTCASYYGYHGEGSFHDSLEDVRATLHCFRCMIQDEEERKVPHREEEYCQCGELSKGVYTQGDANGFGYWEFCLKCGKKIEDGFHYYNHYDGADHDDIDIY